MVNIISFNHSSSYIVRFAPSLHLDFCNLPVVQFYSCVCRKTSKQKRPVG